MGYRVADIAGAVSRADADNRQERLADLQLRTGEQKLAQGSRLGDLQLEDAQMGMQQKKRGEAVKQIEITGKLAEQVLASGGKNYGEFMGAMQQLGIPTESLPQQYDQATMQNFVDKSKAFMASEYENIDGPRGALLQREKRTGKLNQVVAPEQRQPIEKAPPGYRLMQDGSMATIKGGPADQKALMQQAGGDTVNTVVAGLRDLYDQLDAGGGITSTQKGVAGNIMAGSSSSGIGQFAGRMLGTENQSKRNTIAQQRPLLLQAIMKATGMSAKQMDSNAELKLYLATATDPTLDVQSNKRALDMIEKLYGNQNSQVPPATDSPSKTIAVDW